MPQATTELTNEWGGPSETKAMNHLKSQGYALTRDWCWIPTAGHYVTDKDRRAAMFLIQEWDFGGIIEPEESQA